LLTTPSLRAAFAHSPHELARRLGIESGDVETFAALDQEAVKRQSDLLAFRQSQVRRADQAGKKYEGLFVSMAGADRTLLKAASETRMADLSRPSIQRYYRLLTTDFCLRFSSRAEEASIHRSLAHLEIEPPPGCDVVIDVLESAEGHILIQDIVPLAFCAHLDQLGAFVQVRMRQVAIDRHPFFLQIHAGLVSNGHRCLLLPGPPGHGKTTLTAALTFSGFRFFSDEIAILEGDPLEARAVPLGLAIKSGAVDVRGRLWPEVRALPIDVREDGEVVRYLVPPREVVAAEARAPVGWIVFPRYTPGANTSLRAVSKADALRRLMAECLVLPNSLERSGVQIFAQWIRSVETYELIMGPVTEAVAELQRLSGMCP